jgi:hypothetical protein
MIEKYIGAGCIDAAERLSGQNSIMPSEVFKQLNVVYLEISKDRAPK